MDELDAVLDAELLVNVVDMIFDRVVRDEEGFRDLLVTLALEEQTDDLTFPGGDAVLLAARGEGIAVVHAERARTARQSEKPPECRHPDVSSLPEAGRHMREIAARLLFRRPGRHRFNDIAGPKICQFGPRSAKKRGGGPENTKARRPISGGDSATGQLS